ncbi:Flp pilus assembly protein CpaB [Candidatus Halocynthiibacter alkanivorans]|uniref:Flp pilus assembly protein CpaB n=1 Tax=Candidatus Halocynthiibacter alkanivorans TaxID=2267619 RepID=UPI000DF16B06|nr:Flp pilus assembly protein CpaB [Candidatus Halocynthiibacter alkanivorans]
MRLSSLLLALTGLTVAGGSAYVARTFIESQTAQAAPSENAALVKVVVAGRDIAFGQAIERQMLTTISWPRDAVPAGTFSDFATLTPSTAGMPPRRAKRAISQGELVLGSKVSEFGEKVTIVQTLGPNRRAIAISVSAATAVGGFVTPGDFVDILLTQGRGAALRAVTILQDIRVIGVDQDSDEQNDAPEVARTVTVEVTPEQGQRLALAQKAGTLSLTLRTLDSNEDVPLESIRLSDLMRDLSPVPEDAPTRSITVRRGNVATTIELN